jgi:hypothetical protein
MHSTTKSQNSKIVKAHGDPLPAAVKSGIENQNELDFSGTESGYKGLNDNIKENI